MNHTHNLNDMVRVRLLPPGLEIIKRERERMASIFPSQNWDNYLKPDAEGYLNMQLWSVMHHFGAACDIDFNPPFETEIKWFDSEVRKK